MPKPSFADLKECVENFIKDMAGINEKRLESAEKEMENINRECIAFNILCANVSKLGVADGVS